MEYSLGYPVLLNDPAMIERVHCSSQKALGSCNVTPISSIPGSEDFAYFLQERPGAFFWLGAGNPDKGIDKPHHHPEFDIDEAALPAGVKVMVQLALDYLSEKTAD
jgi:amidohydrolase